MRLLPPEVLYGTVEIDSSLLQSKERARMLLPLFEREIIRRAYHVEGKSIRQISLEPGHFRDAIRRAITDAQSDCSCRFNSLA